jgi:hypothetical protein
METFDSMFEEEDIDPVTGQPYQPNTPRDPDDPREKMRTYLANKLASEKKMATPEFRQANRAPMDALQGSNRELAMGKLMMNSANQMGTMGGKSASSKGFDEYSDQMMSMNQAAGQNMLRERQDAIASDDRQGKMLQYLADKYQSAEDKEAARKLQSDKIQKDDAYRQETLGLKKQELALQQHKSTGAAKATDARNRDFAKRYNEWKTTDKGTFQKNMQALDDAIMKLEGKDTEGKPYGDGGMLGYTGTAHRFIPNIVRPEGSLGLQEQVEGALQGAMKATLGPQFTEKEGVGILKRGYNPGLSPAENVRKLKAERERLLNNGRVMDDMSAHFETHGTMDGWDDSRSLLIGDPEIAPPPPAGAPKAPPAPPAASQQQQQTTSPEEDAQALEWAQANRDHPKAIEILRLHGGQ